MKYFLKILVLLISFFGFVFVAGCQSQQEKQYDAMKIVEDGQHIKYLATFPVGTLLLSSIGDQPLYFMKGPTEDNGSFKIFGINKRVVWNIDTTVREGHRRFVPIDSSLWAKTIAKEGFGITLPEK